MSLANVHAAVIASAIQRSNFVRGPRPFGESFAHKEWLHFSINSERLDLVVNFSVFQEPGARAGGEPVGRLIVLLRGPETSCWRGYLQEVGPGDVKAAAGGHLIALGTSFVRFHRQRFELFADVKEAGLTADLQLVPLTVPGQANNSTLPRGGVLHWLFVPRLRAIGGIDIDGRRWPIEAAAYHDHNWGHFCWGGDFAWEWGYALPMEDGPFSLVCVRLSDRGHTHDLSRSLFLWNGARQIRLFRDGQIEVEHEGLLRPGKVTRVPGIMRLLIPGEACEVPRRVRIVARAGDDYLSCVYEAESVVQIGVPHDADWGATLINEVAGTIRVTGQVAGLAMNWAGRAFFEFLEG